MPDKSKRRLSHEAGVGHGANSIRHPPPAIRHSFVAGVGRCAEKIQDAARQPVKVAGEGAAYESDMPAGRRLLEDDRGRDLGWLTQAISGIVSAGYRKHNE